MSNTIPPTMDPRRFHKRLLDAIVDILPVGAKIVCAVSGGIDSVAMLHGLVAVNEIHERKWLLQIAHLDHGLRDSSIEDARFVETLARSLGLPHTCRTEDVGGEAKRSGESPEEVGRRLRYAFLEEVAEQVGAGYICVAHHADDQAETVLHRILRGTGIRGLSGMAPVRPVHHDSTIQLVRPLLSFERRDLQAYLESRKLDWRHDHTNDDPAAATRNKIRHELLPRLRDTFNAEITAALTRLAENARRANDAIHQLALDALRHMHLDELPTSIRLAVAPIVALPAAVQGEIIILILNRLDASRKEIGFERMDAILELVTGGDHKRHIELPGGSIVMRQGKWLTIERITPPASNFNVTNPQDAAQA
ncbi:MAG: tRNA lysidine(34) synthetase TilS [Planctomycetota bacterium]